MIWFYLAIGSALSFASMNLFARVASVKSKNPRAKEREHLLKKIFAGVIAVVGVFLLV